MERVKCYFFALVMVMVVLMTNPGNAESSSKSHVAPTCVPCHKAENNEIWGTVVPYSQLTTDGFFKVQSGDKTWHIRYDTNTKLKKFRTLKELPNNEGVRIRFSSIRENEVYAEEISYKPNYSIKDPGDVIYIHEVVELLKRKPKDGDWMLFDARGYDNYIEGHLPGAILLPYYEMDSYMDRLPKDKNTLIVSYCRGGT